MALLLRQIYKSHPAYYLLLTLIGSLSFLAFEPFNVKAILPFTYAAFIHAVLDAQTLKIAFKRSLAWGFGFWLSGLGWLIVSIHYYGNTSIYIALIIILLMSFLLSLVFIAPASMLRFVIDDEHWLISLLGVASSLTIIELSRFYILGGVPWLLPGLIFLDTPLSEVIPIFGVYGASWIIYFFAGFLALNFKNFWRISPSVIGLVLILMFPYSLENEYQESDFLDVALVQPAHSPFTKYEDGYKIVIENALIKLSQDHQNQDLIIWPESPFPYLNSSKEMENFLKRLDGLPPVISGGWQYNDSELKNVMTVVGESQVYEKTHLVPFGEYVPFESLLRGLISFFNMPMSSVIAGQGNQELFQVGKYQALGLICFDIAFPLTFISQTRKADFIINISNDTWFGSSYGPIQHLQISRVRALESNKWLVRVTSDGISAIIDNKGTIVSKINKGISGSLQGRLYPDTQSSFYLSYGYPIIPLFSFFWLLCSFVLRFRP